MTVVRPPDEHRVAEIIATLRRQENDDARVEAKSAVRELGKSVWETVSAFANTEGGIILLGVDEKNGFVPAEGFDVNRTLDMLDGHLYGEKPIVTPVPNVRFDRVPLEGREVVAMVVEPMHDDIRLTQEMPCFVTARGVKNGSFKRVVDKDKVLSAYEIFELQMRTKPDKSDSEVVEGATEADLNPQAVKALLGRLEQSGSRIGEGAVDETQILKRLNVLSPDGGVTVAGLLTLGYYPQQFFPQLFVDVAVHPGTEKSAHSSVRFLDRKECDGPIPEAIDVAVSAVLKNLRQRHVEKGTTTVIEYEIPEMVLREAITNAVMHRDYGFRRHGQQVAVNVFADRVEITSPGGLWGDRTLDNIDDGSSMSRNQVLVKLLSHTPRVGAAGVVAENAGTGIQRMRAGMQAEMLPTPEFRADIGQFVVILQRFGMLNPDTDKWLTAQGHKRNNVDDVVLLLAQNEGAVTPHVLRDHMGVDSDEAREILAHLVEEEALVEAPYREETYVLPGSILRLSAAEQEVMAILSATQALGINEIAEKTGRSKNTLRPLLRDLVDARLVVATAPPQSRNRAYLRVS